MLHERDDLLALLEGHLAAAAQGRGRVVLVAGEPGCGKTSLLRALARTVRGRLLWGGCEALATPRPFGPLHDFVEGLGAPARAAFLADGPRGHLFATLLDELAVDSPRPTVLVIDDLHWADEATLDLVKYLGRRVHQQPALIVLGHRDDEASMARLRPVFGDLPGRDVARIIVPLLTPEAVHAMATAAGRDAEGLHAATGGNAFFVTEALTHVGHGAPATVRDAVLARTWRLEPAAREIVELAAVVPRAIELELVRAVLAATDGALQATLDAGLLVLAGDMLAFRHELARVAVEEGLGPLRSRAWHGRVLAALRAGGIGSPALARLVHHAQGAHDAAAVLQAAPLAAREAARRGARREAIAHARCALRQPQGLPPIERARLLEELATCEFELGNLESAIAARAEAISLFDVSGHVESHVEALAAQALPLVRALDNAQADACSRRAIALAQALVPGPAHAKAYGVECYLRMLNRELDEAVDWGKRALALARDCGSREAEVAALVPLGAATLFSDFDRGCALLEQAITLAAPLPRGDAWIADAYVMLGSAAGEIHRFAAAERWLDEGVAFARARDLDRVGGYMAGWQALCDVARGRWDRAGERAHALIARELAGSTNRVTALIALGRLRVRRADPRADEVLDEALELALRSGTLQRLAPVCAARAEAAWFAGDSDAVRAEVTRVFELAVARRHPWFIGELAFWRAQVDGSAALSGEVAALCAEPWRLQLQGRWREAAAAWTALDCPYESARALGDGDEAARRGALVVLDRLGARPLAERVRGAMRAQGVAAIPRGPRATTRANAAGLTAREMQVLALLAAGEGPAAIARALSRSPRTIEHHAESIVAKLQSQDRASAIAAARRLGLLDD